MHLRREYRNLLITAATIFFALILAYLMFPAFSALVDQWTNESVKWIEKRILFYFP